MDHNQNLQRIVAHMATVMGAETLRTTLNLTYDRMADVAARLVAEFGPDITGAQIDLAVYAIASNPQCKHLFAPIENTETAKEEKPNTPPQLYGLPREVFLSLPPQARMAIVDADEAAKRANTAATNQAEADALAFASLPPGAETWSPERRLQHSNEAAALAAKQRQRKSAA